MIVKWIMWPLRESILSSRCWKHHNVIMWLWIATTINAKQPKCNHMIMVDMRQFNLRTSLTLKTTCVSSIKTFEDYYLSQELATQIVSGTQSTSCCRFTYRKSPTIPEMTKSSSSRRKSNCSKKWLCTQSPGSDHSIFW